MNGMFDEREQAYENKYAHDQELEFRIRARTHKLFGRYIAEQLGMDEARSASFALELVEQGMARESMVEILEKSRVMLLQKNLTMSEEELRQQYMAHYAQAEKEVKAAD